MRCAALLLLAALGACAGDPGWPRWRGPGGRGVLDGAPLPSWWRPESGVAWTIPLPGEGSSSPVVSGDAVYITAALDDGTRRALYCHDLKTGDRRWAWEMKDPDPERASALTGHAAATPATDGRRIVVFFGNAGAACIDRSGRELWRRPLGPFDSELGLASSPILHKNLAILVCDHDGDRFKTFDSFLIALDLDSGRTVWTAPRPGLFRSWSTPILADGALIVSGQDAVRAYDPDSGRPLWSVDGMSGWVTPSPVAGLGLVFAVSGKDGPTVAIRPGGQVAWREERGGPYVCSPLLYGDELYVCDEGGRLVVRDAASGVVRYRQRLPGKFTGSPVAGDGKVYLTNEAGTTTVLQAGPEFKVLAENPLGEECLASPALLPGGLLIRTRRHLWRIGK